MGCPRSPKRVPKRVQKDDKRVQYLGEPLGATYGQSASDSCVLCARFIHTLRAALQDCAKRWALVYRTDADKRD